MIKICILCKKKYEGYGNNSSPLAIGRCCDICNSTKVVPYRIKRSYGIT